ncbi:MAG: peroxide stress protein YaaA [Clostridia bacterium]
MKIIISPAKKMNIDSDSLDTGGLPVFLDKTSTILDTLRSLSYDELKAIWKCNDSIATLNFERIQKMDLTRNLTPAILSYEGIQYKYMSPAVFENSMFTYISEHLRILSAFYGVLKPMDGVVPYRLEMQASVNIENHANLYDFWGDNLHLELNDDVILNLASKEYSKCIEKHLKPTNTLITCVFGELSNGKITQKATFAKMARGEMVRFMACNNIENLTDIKKFNALNFIFSCIHSTETEYVFLRNTQK